MYIEKEELPEEIKEIKEKEDIKENINKSSRRSL